MQIRKFLGLAAQKTVAVAFAPVSSSLCAELNNTGAGRLPCPLAGAAENQCWPPAHRQPQVRSIHRRCGKRARESSAKSFAVVMVASSIQVRLTCGSEPDDQRFKISEFKLPSGRIRPANFLGMIFSSARSEPNRAFCHPRCLFSSGSRGSKNDWR